MEWEEQVDGMGRAGGWNGKSRGGRARARQIACTWIRGWRGRGAARWTRLEEAVGWEGGRGKGRGAVDVLKEAGVLEGGRREGRSGRVEGG
eukprot:283026-Chlamydomonas_euryale.AAC.1